MLSRIAAGVSAIVDSVWWQWGMACAAGCVAASAWIAAGRGEMPSVATTVIGWSAAALLHIHRALEMDKGKRTEGEPAP